MKAHPEKYQGFPFLFGGTFIEAALHTFKFAYQLLFPFLFGGTFIEAFGAQIRDSRVYYFPSFSEGLSLRLHARVTRATSGIISLPFRRDFH